MTRRRFASASAAAALVACSTARPYKGLKPESERNSAPDFTLRDSMGRLLKLSDYKGKAVLLNFWATWCGPCKMEIPWFVEFEQQYKDKGFAVLGISMDDDGWDAVRPFADFYKINYRTAIGDPEVQMRYGGVEALPTSFMIDKEGRIASVHVGLVSRSTYQRDIQQLLGMA